MAVKPAHRELFRSILKLLFVLTLSMLCALLIAGLGVGNESVIMVFLLGVLFVTVLTNGYIYGLAASVASPCQSITPSPRIPSTGSLTRS